MMPARTESILSQPIDIGGRTALNRIVYQSMEANDADERGRPTDNTFRRYRRFAAGGPGIIFLEAITVSHESRGRVNQLRINEDTADSLGELVAAMKGENPGPLVLFQITHDGRQSGGFSRVVSVYPAEDPSIELLTAQELQDIGDQFARAAAIARSVGADGIDFKHCHGYLCCEMLRPANRREDEYGGSFENRTRFFRETLAKIKEEVNDPSFILGCRISAHEPQPGGFGTAGPASDREDLSETVAFARLMETEGMHYVNVSAGRPLSVPAKDMPEAVFHHFRMTEEVKKSVDLPVIGSAYSLLRDGDNRLEGTDPHKKSFRYWAERNIEEGRVDMVGLGRQSFADPLFAGKFLSSAEEIDYCTLCNGCFKLLHHQVESGCAVYDEYYRTLLKEVSKDR
jgi:2,4-dienoyl-CoA reductase-like NADH-dependent reductase (Old Yellow Enzyme family)